MFDTEQYKHELEQIEVSKAERTKPERILNSKEHTQFRGSVGSLGWLVDHCCPQLSFQLAELVLHLRVCGGHVESRTSDGRWVHWIGREAVCRAHSRGEAQCETAALSLGEHGKEESSVDSRQKCGIASWRRSIETHQV